MASVHRPSVSEGLVVAALYAAAVAVCSGKSPPTPQMRFLDIGRIVQRSNFILNFSVRMYLLCFSGCDTPY